MPVFFQRYNETYIDVMSYTWADCNSAKILLPDLEYFVKQILLLPLW